MSRINARNGALVVLLAGVVFSFGPLTFRWKTDGTTEWQFLFYRSGTLALAVALLFASRHGHRSVAVFRQSIAKTVIAGALLMGMFTAFIVAIARIDAATTLVLQSLAPFSAALIGWILLRERVDRNTWAAMFGAAVGVIVMASGWDSSDAVGIVLAASIPLMFGGYSVLLRDTEGRDPLAPIVAAGVFGTVVGGVVSIASGDGLGVPLNDVAMGTLSGGVLLGIGIPLMNTAGQYVPAARTTLLLLTEILLAPVWVWLIVDEDPTAETVVGGIVILAALAWLATHPSRDANSMQLSP